MNVLNVQLVGNRLNFGSHARKKRFLEWTIEALFGA